MNPIKKAKLKKVLLALSSEEERDRLLQKELLNDLVGTVEKMDKKTEEKLDGVKQSFGQRYDKLFALLEESRHKATKHSSMLLQSIIDLSDALNKRLGDMQESNKTLTKTVADKVSGPTKAEDSNLAIFDGGSGKKIKDSELSLTKIKYFLDKIDRIEKDSRRRYGILYGGGSNIATDTFTTTGGAQTVPLSHIPLLVLVVDVNGQVLNVAAGDYTTSGINLNLLNASLPSGVYGKVAYTY